ncbi:MAG TPA: TMEM175 family protein [Roseiflexaceae bacterium]|nr:TMEM175 family protein [Roseiflexaceae bacterium]
MKHVAGKRTNRVTSATPDRGIIEDHLGLERLIFFSDAVFAIAVTLLALEIRLPDATDLDNDAQLLAALAALGPKYFSYVISFLVIGSYWLVHHRSFRHIVRYDRRLLMLNLLLLMVVAFLPFPSSVIGESNSRVATIFYALTMVITGLLSAMIWLHAHRHGRLTDQQLAPPVFRQGLLRSLIPPAIFLISIALAYIDSDLARYSWISIAFVSLLLRQTTSR